MMVSFMMGNNTSWDSDLMQYGCLESGDIASQCTFDAFSASPLYLHPKFWNTAVDASLLSSMNCCLKNSTGWRRTPRGPSPWWQNRPSSFSSQDGTLFHSPRRTSSFQHASSLEQPWLWHYMPPDCTVSGRSCVLGLVRCPTQPPHDCRLGSKPG